MDKKIIGYGLIVIGAIMMMVSITADVIGLGQDPLNFGWKQILGAGAGLVVANVGMWVLVIRRVKSEEQNSSKNQHSEKPEDLL